MGELGDLIKRFWDWWTCEDSFEVRDACRLIEEEDAVEKSRHKAPIIGPLEDQRKAEMLQDAKAMGLIEDSDDDLNKGGD